MEKVSEERFAQICEGIKRDREKIILHNPIGTDEEILLWMLLSVLISYLSLSELETPCFTGVPDAETYRKAIRHVLRDRRETDFDIEPFLERFSTSEGAEHAEGGKSAFEDDLE
ncbi:MAG: hypothetical protein IPM63_14135 [Acidobacteriota bacterium]|nr:MAG: hypothetical protein IPM63_14135 [Acidobacteriota bacterium]